jgi:hypothetical protein
MASPPDKISGSYIVLVRLFCFGCQFSTCMHASSITGFARIHMVACVAQSEEASHLHFVQGHDDEDERDGHKIGCNNKMYLTM